MPFNVEPDTGQSGPTTQLAALHLGAPPNPLVSHLQQLKVELPRQFDELSKAAQLRATWGGAKASDSPAQARTGLHFEENILQDRNELLPTSLFLDATIGPTLEAVFDVALARLPPGGTLPDLARLNFLTAVLEDAQKQYAGLFLPVSERDVADLRRAQLEVAIEAACLVATALEIPVSKQTFVQMEQVDFGSRSVVADAVVMGQRVAGEPLRAAREVPVEGEPRKAAPNASVALVIEDKKSDYAPGDFMVLEAADLRTGWALQHALQDAEGRFVDADRRLTGSYAALMKTMACMPNPGAANKTLHFAIFHSGNSMHIVFKLPNPQGRSTFPLAVISQSIPVNGRAGIRSLVGALLVSLNSPKLNVTYLLAASTRAVVDSLEASKLNRGAATQLQDSGQGGRGGGSGSGTATGARSGIVTGRTARDSSVYEQVLGGRSSEEIENQKTIAANLARFVEPLESANTKTSSALMRTNNDGFVIHYAGAAVLFKPSPRIQHSSPESVTSSDASSSFSKTDFSTGKTSLVLPAPPQTLGPSAPSFSRISKQVVQPDELALPITSSRVAVAGAGAGSGPITLLVDRDSAVYGSTSTVCSAVMGGETNDVNGLMVKLADLWDLTWEPEYIPVLRKEAMLLQNKLFGVDGITQTVAYLAMQERGNRIQALLMVDAGKPIRSWEDLSPFQRKKLLATIHQVHERGIVHRDLEPRNVVTRGEDVTLIDFSHATEHDCRGAACPEIQRAERLLYVAA